MKIQLKRSNQLAGDNAKPPTAAQMEYGEIAVNYNNEDPVLFIKDSTDQIIRIAGKGAEGGFTGDYNDLINTPTIGDGTITINNSDGSENATFTVNQTGDTEVTLPAGFSGDYDDLVNKADLQAVTDVGNTTTNGASFAGNVGIGTTSPSSKLDVRTTSTSGISVTNFSNAPRLDFLSNNLETAARIQVNESFGGGVLSLSTKDTNGTITERMKISNDGSATFAGDVTIGDLSATGEWIRLRTGTNTDINLRSNDENKPTFWQYYNGTNPTDITYIVRSSGRVDIGGSLNLSPDLSLSTPNILLDPSGSATFADQITATKGYALAQLPALEAV